MTTTEPSRTPPRPRPSARSSSLLRFVTAGSVDDGKSTLIGRLLFDTKQILADQMAHVEEASRRRGFERTELALLTDGLRAEREQGITIDVAYRPFATPRRSFLVADTPGHVQYTRNMVTGASTADLALILVDARHGLVEQSRRHAFVSSLLGIKQLFFCVNKVDLVGYDPARFDQLRRDIEAFAARLGPIEPRVFPVSALHGDNVVEPSTRTPWYHGPTLLAALEDAPTTARGEGGPLRFAVQWVVRPQTDAHHDYRAYAGQISGGVVRPGDEVVVLPQGARTRVASIDTLDGPLDYALAPRSVALRLTDAIDVARGDLIASPHAQPTLGHDLSATVCWMSTTPLRPRARYLMKHLTRTLRVDVVSIDSRVDVTTLERQPSPPTLALNEIGRLTLRVHAPLAYDPYAQNRSTGSFILIDEATNDTVGAAMIEG